MQFLYSLHKFLLQKLKRLFQFLVYDNEYIRNEYERFLYVHAGISLWDRYKKVFLLNLHYRVGIISPSKNKKRIEPESMEEKLPPPEELVNKLSKYDIISFDVFDTLIFRAFNPCTSIFVLLEHKLIINDFSQIRINVEKELMKEKRNYTLEDIYLRIEQKLKLPHQKGIAAEIEMEQKVCYANPYMQTVFQKLYAMKKQIIFTTDMYLPKTAIRSILTNCGYPEECPVFLSCDIDRQKGDGTMFEYLKSRFPGKKMIHIGDNAQADFSMAKKHQIDAFLYPNCNCSGAKYREVLGMDKIAASAYSAVVNAKMHSDDKKYSGAYEYGYIYGGFLIHAFCQWLMEQKKLYSIDVLLLIARDGDILNQYFGRFYDNVEREYVLWSRAAAVKYTAGDDLLLFSRLFFWNKTIQSPQPSTLKDLIKYSQLDSLKIFPETEWDMNSIPNEKTLLKIEERLSEKWSEIQAFYQEQCSAYCQYLKKIIGNRKRIALVDVGWNGTCAKALSKLIQQNIPGTNVEIFMYGGNCYANTTYKDSMIRTFAFSGSMNTNLANEFFSDYYSTTLLEILFDSSSLSYQGIEKSENGFQHVFTPSHSKNDTVISEVSKGILDFSADFIKKESFFSEHYMISGRDSFIPISYILKQKAFFAKHLAQYKPDFSPGDSLAQNSPDLSRLFSKK